MCGASTQHLHYEKWTDEAGMEEAVARATGVSARTLNCQCERMQERKKGVVSADTSEAGSKVGLLENHAALKVSGNRGLNLVTKRLASPFLRNHLRLLKHKLNRGRFLVGRVFVAL